MESLQDLKNKFDIIGNAPSLNFALQTAERVAPTDLTVLISGESGVGKEVFSKIIHQLSRRKHQPFIAINCGAIPEGTIDSELFGHEKGSFTGAVEKRKGYFESVNHGTIFLDEIGEMPLGTQARLLRLLQNGEFIKVGSSVIQKVDVRIIAATNVNLIEQVQKGKFREDLYYRLNTVGLEVPPLRERGEDIVLLFRKFSADFCERNSITPPKLTDEAKEMLLQYRWPGNVRQLKNIAEQVNLLSDDAWITPQDLQRFLPHATTAMNLVSAPQGDYGGSGNSNFSDISLKLLLEMRQDINDIKKLFVEMSKGNFFRPNNPVDFPQNAHFQGEMREFPPQEINLPYDRNPNYNAPYNPSKVIPLGESTQHNPQKKESPFENIDLNLADMEKKLIEASLKKNKGKRKYAAQELGISERTLYRKIIDYNLEY